MAGQVVLGLGANLGNPVEQLRRAIDLLNDEIRIGKISSVYRTAPVGYADQPDFFNLVCLAETTLSAGDLLKVTQATEAELGRERSFRNAPRTIDVDVLAYGDLTMDTELLTLPHPRMHERAFVLVPLVEIAPDWRHPSLGRTASELLEALGSGGNLERWGALPPR